jgi:hypothetical protein
MNQGEMNDCSGKKLRITNYELKACGYFSALSEVHWFPRFGVGTSA